MAFVTSRNPCRGFLSTLLICLCTILAIFLWRSCGVSAVESRKGKDTSHLLVCYFSGKAGSREGDGFISPKDLDPNTCTHLIYGFALLIDNKIKSQFPWTDLQDDYGKGFYNKFNSLRSENPKLITLISVGGWTEEDLQNNYRFSGMANDPENRRIFIDSVVEFISTYGFQGLDLSWQYALTRDRRLRPEDKMNYVILLKELKAAFESHGYILTAALAAGVPDGSYNIPEISKSVDVINLMTFDYNMWTSYTAPNSPIHPRPEETGDDRFRNVDHTIKTWLQGGADKKKIAMGIPFYGRCYTLADKKNNDFGAPSKYAGRAGPHTKQEGYMGYNELCLKDKRERWHVMVNEFHLAPYMYNDVQNNDVQWCSFDDIASVISKVQYLKGVGLGGAMVWSLDTDDFKGLCSDGKFPLLSSIVGELKSQNPHTTTPSWTTTTAVPTTTESLIGLCKGVGLIPFPNDCSKYLSCQDVGGGLYDATEGDCPDRHVFNPRNKYCDYLENVPECD